MANPVLFPAEEQLAFYVAIGTAITQWAHVEHSLYWVSCEQFGGSSGQIGVGFFSIENFRSKLGFADKLVQTREDFAQFEVEWSKIREEIRSLSSLRNQIAHGRLIHYPTTQPGRRMALVPYFPPKSKKPAAAGKPPNGSLCLKDIDLAARRFSKASIRLQSLFHRMRGEEDMFAECAQQEPQHQTLAQLRLQIYRMLPPREEA